MGKRVAIDLRKACAEAWAGLWADNLRTRAEGRDFRGETYHLTATDLERVIRAKVARELEGQREFNWREWRFGTAWPVRVSVPGHRNLLDGVRSWLQAQRRAGVLVAHNFGRGHISGARYRPAGEPLGPQEAETIERHERRRANPTLRPVHATVNGRAVCQYRPGLRYGWRRYRVRSASERQQVTCKACANLLAAKISFRDHEELAALRKLHDNNKLNPYLHKDEATAAKRERFLRLAKIANAQKFGKERDI